MEMISDAVFQSHTQYVVWLKHKYSRGTAVNARSRRQPVRMSTCIYELNYVSVSFPVEARPGRVGPIIPTPRSRQNIPAGQPGNLNETLETSYHPHVIQSPASGLSMGSQSTSLSPATQLRHCAAQVMHSPGPGALLTPMPSFPGERENVRALSSPPIRSPG